MGKRINRGSRSLLEFFAMEQVLNYCMKKEIPASSVIIYNAMAEIVTQYENVLPLSEKSVSEVETFLREHEYNLTFYKTLCITSLKLQNYLLITDPNSCFDLL